MLLLLAKELPPAAHAALLDRVRGLGYEPVARQGAEGGMAALAVPEPVRPEHAALMAGWEGVVRVLEEETPPPAAGPLAQEAGAAVVEVGAEEAAVRAVFGPATFSLVAGPCAVEGLEGLLELAQRVRRAGAVLLRGGAFKPRTSPYSFQGLGRDGIAMLREARARTGLPFVTEVLDPRDVEFVARHADMLQVGSRNQQNFPLLREVGRAGRPVLLKRGMACTLREFLLAAEYVLEADNADVVLCERGVRGFDPSARNLLDLAAVPALRERTRLPVVVDPSHGTGRRSLVPAMARAAAAAGADGVMVEVHAHPEAALCDGQQALLPGELDELAPALFAHARLVGRLAAGERGQEREAEREDGGRSDPARAPVGAERRRAAAEEAGGMAGP